MSNYELLEKHVNKVNAQGIFPTGSELTVNTNYGVQVNLPHKDQLRIAVNVAVLDPQNGKQLVEVLASGVFKTPSENEETVKITDLEHPEEPVNQILPEAADMIGHVTEKMYGAALTVPREIKPDFLQQNQKSN